MKQSKNAISKAIIAERAARSAEVMTQHRLRSGLMASAPFGENFADFRYTVHDGEKFDGGLGPVNVPWTDYWALRQRSAAFFKTNQYGRGIIRRMVTNIINTGLSLEADPLESLIDSLDEESAEEWGIDVENRWDAWCSTPEVCDYSRQLTYGQLQEAAYREALIDGDVLVIEHHNSLTNLPCYELINGTLINTPLGGYEATGGNEIKDGVEVSPSGEHVAFHILQADLTYKRIPARGKNGRLLAWMVYATDKRYCEVRGEPFLSLVMQGVSEVDRYRDAVQRKAAIGALLSVFFYQSPEASGISSKPISAGAQRRVVGSTQSQDNTDYKFDIASVNPGVVYEVLPPGVEPKGFKSDATDEKFSEFEKAMLDGISWALEIPPSIIRMTFDSSYSASRGEVKEFNLVMRNKRNSFSDQMNRPAYRSWLLAMVLTGRIKATGLIDAWRDPADYEGFAAWTNSNWWGVVKEAVDLPKEVAGQEGLVKNGWSTNASVARQMTGTRFASNIRKVARENQRIADAARPMLELIAQYGQPAVDDVMKTEAFRLHAVGDIDK